MESEIDQSDHAEQRGTKILMLVSIFIILSVSLFYYDLSHATAEDNPIPLPPRDRTRPHISSKARHQRKHPLIIPASGISRTLAMVSRDTLSPGQMDQSLTG